MGNVVTTVGKEAANVAKELGGKVNRRPSEFQGRTNMSEGKKVGGNGGATPDQGPRSVKEEYLAAYTLMRSLATKYREYIQAWQRIGWWLLGALASSAPARAEPTSAAYRATRCAIYAQRWSFH